VLILLLASADDLNRHPKAILDSPHIYGLAMAFIEATVASITTLLKLAMRFVIGITLNFMTYLKTWDKSYEKKLATPKVPTFILSLTQRRRSPPLD